MTKSVDSAGLLEKSLYGIGRLCTVSDPLLCLFGVDLNFSRLGHRIVGTDNFDEATISGVTGVSYYYAVVGVLLSTDSCKS